MAESVIEEKTYQALMNKLGEDGPILREKTFNVDEPFEVKNESGDIAMYSYWDVVYRADETYWSPLADESRLSLTDVGAYQVKSKENGNWLSMREWFELDK